MQNLAWYKEKINLWKEKIINKYPITSSYSSINLSDLEFLYVSRKWIYRNFRNGRLDACIVRNKIDRSTLSIIFKYPDIEFAREKADDDEHFNRIMIGYKYTEVIGLTENNKKIIEAQRVPISEHSFVSINIFDHLQNKRYFVKYETNRNFQSKGADISISETETSKILWASKDYFSYRFRLFDAETKNQVLQIKKRKIMRYIINSFLQTSLLKPILTFDIINPDLPLSIVLILGFESIINFYL